MIRSWPSAETMRAADVLVLGGPAAGKTHYAGQLLGRLRNDRRGILRVRVGKEGDLHQFEEVLACLEEGRSAGHTPGETWTGMKCQLQLRDRNDIVLEWPEYAGERFASIVDKHRVTAEWEASIEGARAWLLFVRLSTLTIHEDLLTRPVGCASDPAPMDSLSGGAAAWDDRARYVEILQMLLFAARRSTSRTIRAPRLAVVFSCWDELDERGTPEGLFRKRLPLLHAFVRSTWAEDSWSAWGLSSLGRALRPDCRDDEFVRRGPEHFGYVIRPGRTDHDPDLTAPVAWLLQV